MDRMMSRPLFTSGMFVGMLVCLEIGRRLGSRRLAADPKEAMAGLDTVQGAVFALYGLLLAFTFSGAPARLDIRKQLIAQEANAIGTAYLRLDLLSPGSQPALRELFRQYLDSRLEAYRKMPDVDAAIAALSKSTDLQGEIWTQAITAIRMPGCHPVAGNLLLPALNEMIGITTTRTMAAR